MKSGSFRGLQRKMAHTSYRNFDVDFFNEALQEKMRHLENDAGNTFDSCLYICLNTCLDSCLNFTTKELWQTWLKYRNNHDRLSIKKIKEFALRINVNYFNFETISMDDVKILNLIIQKSYHSNSILTTIFKMSIDIPLPYLT